MSEYHISADKKIVGSTGLEMSLYLPSELPQEVSELNTIATILHNRCIWWRQEVQIMFFQTALLKPSENAVRKDYGMFNRGKCKETRCSFTELGKLFLPRASMSFYLCHATEQC